MRSQAASADSSEVSIDSSGASGVSCGWSMPVKFASSLARTHARKLMMDMVVAGASRAVGARLFAFKS
jgi:hypothetical protein